MWLIFILVLLWTAFPPAFAAIMTALFVPLSLSLLGIVLRGVGFAFRHTAQRLRMQQLTGAIFAASSLITPFFMGTVVGAVATGQVPVHPDRQRAGRLDLAHRHPHRVPVRRRLRLRQRGVPGPGGAPARARRT